MDPSGKRVSESTGKAKKSEAQEKLNERLAEISEGRYRGTEARNLRFADLAELITNYYCGKTSEKRVSIAVERLRGFFNDGHMVSNITYDRLLAYKSKRSSKGMEDGTIKYELSILRQAFNEALKAGKVHYIPPFPRITLHNERREFFSDGEFDALVSELPPYLKPPVTFAFWTGWRMRTEVLTLEWNQVDFEQGVIRLKPGTTKNKDGRELPFDENPVLVEVLNAQRAHTDEVERKTNQVIPLVFHRYGKRIKDHYVAWTSACERAGVLGADGKPKRAHDLRRTAVRRFERSGTSRSVAMALVGHKAQTMYTRYTITNEDDLREGLRKAACVPRDAEHNVHTIDVRHRKGTKSAEKSVSLGWPTLKSPETWGGFPVRGEDTECADVTLCSRHLRRSQGFSVCRFRKQLGSSRVNRVTTLRPLPRLPRFVGRKAVTVASLSPSVGVSYRTGPKRPSRDHSLSMRGVRPSLTSRPFARLFGRGDAS
jgi:integrase